jgi:hypothetical protein
LFDLYADAPVAAAAAERIVAVCRKAIPVSAQAADSTALPAVSTLLAHGIKPWSHHRCGEIYRRRRRHEQKNSRGIARVDKTGLKAPKESQGFCLVSFC